METPLVVAVTGASAGLGRAIAHAYAKCGAKVGLMARNPEALAAAKQEYEFRMLGPAFQLIETTEHCNRRYLGR